MGLGPMVEVAKFQDAKAARSSCARRPPGGGWPLALIRGVTRTKLCTFFFSSEMTLNYIFVRNDVKLQRLSTCRWVPATR